MEIKVTKYQYFTLQLLMYLILFFLSNSCGNKEYPNDFFDKKFNIPIIIIEDSCNLLKNKYLFKTFSQTNQEKYFKMTRIFENDQDIFELDFYLKQINYDSIFSLKPHQYSNSSILKGKIVFKKLDKNYFGSIVLWNNQTNLYYNKNIRKWTIVTGLDGRFFPWNIGKLTNCVYLNFDSSYIRNNYSNFDGAIINLKVDTIYINLNLYSQLDENNIDYFINFRNMRLK